MRANYQFKLWLHADKQCIQSFAGSPESSGGWLSLGIILAIAWSTLPAPPKVCLELVACGCLTKCKSSACKCTPACGCMPKIFVTRHHELSSIIMDQIVLVTFISQYYSNNLVHRLRPVNTSLFWKLCLERHNRMILLVFTSKYLIFSYHMTILLNKKYFDHVFIVIIKFLDHENIILHTEIIRKG